tara:strand:+ start:16063 stop:17919 length:1857 start_codon:yes stop_codon:yes gene_type:complete
MCGICGFTGEGDVHTLDAMMAAMVYRGPDGSGRWSNDRGIYFGHKRLSIVDPDGGQQPMVTDDGHLILAFNGEIYNHVDLRRKLEGYGYRFNSSHADTEVVLHGYHRWGPDLVHHLNGMWAFAIFDQRNGTLFLSRDRFGKKPLFFAQERNSFIFSSELASLQKHPSVNSSLDRDALFSYFAHGYIPAPKSILTGVQKLPAGYNLTYDLTSGRTELQRYWRYKPEPDLKWLTHEDELAEALASELLESIRLRLIADVPVGVFLSGGIDSSSIAALAMNAELGQNVETYSIGFEDKSFDESPYSNDMARLLGSDHHFRQLTKTDCIDALERIYPLLDEPMADSSLIPTFLLCEMARERVSVGLGGDGADELFAGYDPFKALQPANAYARVVPKKLHQIITSITRSLPVSHRNMSLDFKLKRFLSGLGYDERVRNAIWLSTLPPGHVSALFAQPIDLDQTYKQAISSWQAPGVENGIDASAQFYIELYLQNNILTKIDRAGMLNSLEVRAPFLDINLVNLVRTIPSSLKFRRTKTKYILRKAVSKILPVEILNRPKKGFGTPVGRWFKDSVLTINPAVLEGVVDTNVTKRLHKEHLEGKADWRNFLWAHFVLEKWLSTQN